MDGIGILERTEASGFPASFAEQLAKLDPLKDIFGASGDIYITVQKVALKQPDGSTLFDRALNAFTGPHAQRDARDFVANPYEPSEPDPDYITTLVLSAVGGEIKCRSEYQFRL